MHVRFVNMMVILLLVILLVAACGGDEQSGVDLEVAGQTHPTDTPTPEATLRPGQGFADLPGRLLILKGQQFEVFDFATGATTPLEGVSAFSSAALSDDLTVGAFVAFPNFGVIDLASNSAHEIRNTWSTPNGFGISPDGQWMVVLTGTFSARLQLLATDGSSAHSVARNSDGGLRWTWTPDSQLIWWTVGEQDPQGELMVFSPTSGDSTPASDEPLPLIPPPPLVLSPDGTRAANVPIVFVPPPGQDIPATCFDSFVELYQGPFTTQDVDIDGETIWTEAGLIASSPQWLTDDLLLFVKYGTGDCGEIAGDPLREIMVIDTSETTPRPRSVAGPIGNADDPNDRVQQFGRTVSHLYSIGPNGQHIAWIGGGRRAGETTVNVTNVATGSTQTVLRYTAEDAIEFIENTLIRQVVWLPD